MMRAEDIHRSLEAEGVTHFRLYPEFTRIGGYRVEVTVREETKVFQTLPGETEQDCAKRIAKEVGVGAQA